MRNLKVCCIGDEATGKSSFLETMRSGGRFPEFFVRPVEDYSVDVLYDNVGYTLSFVDTNGHEHYDRLRALSYRDVDLFLLFFSVFKPSSVTNIETRWLPELNHYRPDVPVFLVGAKADMMEKMYDKDIQKLVMILTHLYQNFNLRHRFCSSLTAGEYPMLRRVLIDGVACWRDFDENSNLRAGNASSSSNGSFIRSILHRRN